MPPASEEQSHLICRQKEIAIAFKKVQTTPFAFLKFKCKLKFSDEFEQILTFVTGTKDLKPVKAN